MVKSYRIENGIVYEKKEFEEGSVIDTAVGEPIKVDTNRIDAETVEDITYQFDLELGEYVEQSRTTRTEPIPEPEKTLEQIRIEQLESDNLTLMEAVADLYEMILLGGAV